MLIYTPEPEALRAVLRDVFGWEFVEDHPGWLIFKMPPAEIGVHPSSGATTHQICLMCDDIHATVDDLRTKGVETRDEPAEESFGITVTIVLPGGVEVLLYEPTHASPLDL